MKAGVLFAQNDIRCTDWPEPELIPGCVKVRVRACGICGSDVPRVLGTEAHSYPIIPGHEFSGEVYKTAPDVKTLAPGDRIVCAPLLPCMSCDACKAGLYAQCPDYSFIGSRSNGAFAEYVVIPEQNAVKVGDDVSFATGALFEPASVALHGIFRSNFSVGNDAVIMGAGNIGIFLLQWARIFGAEKIAVCDVSGERLKLASDLGASAVFNPADADFFESVSDYTHGRGFNFVYETAGRAETIKDGFKLVSNRGTLTCIGTPHQDFEFGFREWELINRKEFRLTGTWMSYSAPFPGKEWLYCAEYIGRGDIKIPDGIIYKTMPLSQIADAFNMFGTPGAVKGKIMIEI